MTLTFYHVQTINRRFWQARSEFHQSIIRGDFKSPYQYRVVAPWISEAGGRLLEVTLGLAPGKPAAMARECVYVVQRLVAVWLLLICVHLYLETWFAPGIAFGGAMLVGGLHFYSYYSYFYQPSSCLSLLALAFGLVLLNRGSTGWLYPVMAVSSLIRETSGLLILFYVAHRWRRPAWLKHTVGLFAVWLGVQLVLRLTFGLRGGFPARPLSQQVPQIGWPVFLFALLWILPILRFRILPSFLRRSLLLTVPPLVAANCLFGKLEETRLFLDLALILVPASLFGLLYRAGNSAEDLT